MKNRDYWRRRFETLTEAQLSKGEHYLQDLEKQYRQAEKAIQNDINTWYVRFAKNNSISLAEAKRLLNTRELEEFRWTVEEYIKRGKENALSADWMKELENVSARVHISRLESLQVELQQHAEEVYGNHIDATDSLLSGIYEDGYYRTAFEIQKGFGVGNSFAQLDEDRIQKVLSKPWTADGMDFSARIWKDRAQLVDTLHTKLTQSVIRGDAPDRMIAEIAKRFDVSRSRAGRLVMTESAFFASASQRDCFSELGVEWYEVVETLDGRTCPVCGDMDGRVFKMSEQEPSVTAPPFHANCRGCTCPYFGDEEDGERLARDIDSSSYTVPADMTYKKWRAELDKKYGANKINTVQAMAKNESTDFAQYQKYKVIFGKDVPQSFANFQELKYNNSEQWTRLKTLKQATLNSKNFEEIAGLKGKLGNLETRLWYKAHDESIPSLIDKSQSLEQQARKAHQLRNQFRTQARDLMKDQEVRWQLDLKYPKLSFEYYLDKYSKPGADGKIPTMDEVYQKIIEKSTTSNKSFDKKAGVKDES